jgi:hypothetical protein
MHCPRDITNAHSQKKKKELKKSRYSDLFLKTAILTPPRQHQKSSFSESDASKKRTVPLSPDQRS